MASRLWDFASSAAAGSSTTSGRHQKQSSAQHQTPLSKEEKEVVETLTDIKDAYKASLLEHRQKGKHSSGNKADNVINLADMKLLMKTLGLNVNVERLKEVLSVSRAKDVRHRIDLDFFSLLNQLEGLVEDPYVDNEVRRAFSSLESDLGVGKGQLTRRHLVGVVRPFSNFISEQEVDEIFRDICSSEAPSSTTTDQEVQLDVDDFLYTLKTTQSTAAQAQHKQRQQQRQQQLQQLQRKKK
ncbi:uncharacterized protein LOC134842570 isoform X1 [Symsagittifera roscoffensis]|uniref:uncharacterized protein LOC134842570 isoform X1 n=1 Tax=Symsagittifera roscoffensis TaxID=84072 RepID=UPI00307C2171